MLDGWNEWTFIHMKGHILGNEADYMQAKLQERGCRVKAISCHPGVCLTNLAQRALRASGSAEEAQRFSDFIALGMTAEDGALPLIAATVSPEACSGDMYGPWMEGEDVIKVSGEPIVGPPQKLKGPETLSRNEEAQKMLWEASEEAVGQTFFA
jgi:hypothetical protein